MAAALATPPDVEAILCRDLTEDEWARVDRQLELASDRARSLAHQTISLVEDDTFTIAGTQQQTLWLPERPVVSVSSITFDGRAVDASKYQLVAGDGIQWSFGNTWGVTVAGVYTHGYLDGEIPGRIVSIVATFVANQIAIGPDGRDGIGSEGIGNYNYERRELDAFDDDDEKYLRSLAPIVTSTLIETESQWPSALC